MESSKSNRTGNGPTASIFTFFLHAVWYVCCILVSRSRRIMSQTRPYATFIRKCLRLRHKHWIDRRRSSLQHQNSLTGTLFYVIVFNSKDPAQIMPPTACSVSENMRMCVLHIIWLMMGGCRVLKRCGGISYQVPGRITISFLGGHSPSTPAEEPCNVVVQQWVCMYSRESFRNFKGCSVSGTNIPKWII